MRIKEYTGQSRNAIVMLHEIYGINRHIEETCLLWRSNGFNVFCPDLTKREVVFDYTQSEEAYRNFRETIGFKIQADINELIRQIKQQYEKVFLMGYSIGATIAFLCSENPSCDGVVGFYGSRIRDFLAVNPVCPALLIFAEKDSFPVDKTIGALRMKHNVSTYVLEGNHGFMDSGSERFNRKAYEKAGKLTEEFLRERIG